MKGHYQVQTIWGNWRLDSSNLALVHAADKYPIDLERMNSAAQMLDWIFQVNKKAREVYPAQDLADLLQALQDILDPQANLCGGGARKRLDATAYLKQRYRQGTPTRHRVPPPHCKSERQPKHSVSLPAV